MFVLSTEFIKVTKTRMEDSVIGLNEAKQRLYDALHKPELAEANVTKEIHEHNASNRIIM